MENCFSEVSNANVQRTHKLIKLAGENGMDEIGPYGGQVHDNTRTGNTGLGVCYILLRESRALQDSMVKLIHLGTA